MGDLPSSRLASIHAYHDGTKHHFHAFARSLGYLDWASQPDPFRSFAGAPVSPLAPSPGASAAGPPIGEVLRAALGLTAWKVFGASRWSLRANPSSGNLHPTEAYVIAGGAGRPTVSHYAPDRHALEQRCLFDADLPADGFLVALTSVHWRESWKYGERAFRYCQHDLGHAVAAIAVAASIAGWKTELLRDWSSPDIGMLTGVDRESDYDDAEREEPGCVLAICAARWDVSRAEILAGIERGQWTGRANRLSPSQVEWPAIDAAAAATRVEPVKMPPAPATPLRPHAIAARYPRELVVRRRSAVAFDGRSSLGVDRFFEILAQTIPRQAGLFDTLWWTPRVHLALFVHRVDGLDPGLYLLAREPASGERLRAALGREFTLAPVTDSLPLLQLGIGDCRQLAQRVSCNQAIAADGFFSLGMIVEFDAAIAELGPSFYRHLFWETGFVGQVLYLEAERAGARATGIGCFFDDAVHDVLGLEGHAFQSLYHFTLGMPVEDARLTTERAYDWEAI